MPPQPLVATPRSSSLRHLIAQMLSSDAMVGPTIANVLLRVKEKPQMCDRGLPDLDAVARWMLLHVKAIG